MRRRALLPHLRIVIASSKLSSYSGGVSEAVAGFLLLNSVMKGLVISSDSEALTIPCQPFPETSTAMPIVTLLDVPGFLPPRIEHDLFPGVVRVERGDYTPSLELAFKISGYFKLPIEAIFSPTPFRPLSEQVYEMLRREA